LKENMNFMYIMARMRLLVLFKVMELDQKLLSSLNYPS